MKLRPAKITLATVILAVSALLPGGSPATAQPRSAPPDSLDRYVEQQMRERRIPGLSLAISRNGAIVAARAYGLADVQNSVPVTPETRFDLASITKQFTAAGIMLLVEEGRIDLDASIRTYLPDAPEEWADITVRHLLNHTSGFPSAGGVKDPPIDISNEMVYRAARELPLEFEPGKGFQYSDHNYRLLGLIMERASGTPWRKFMPTRVFEPLQMHDTYVVDRYRIHRDEARSYDFRDGELVNARRVYQVETPSHNGIFSNVLDLAKWDAALHADDFLSAESREAMWSPARLDDGTRHPYGFGWALWDLGGRPVQLHGGITGTMLARFPRDTLVVVLLTNLGGGNTQEIALDIAEMMIPDLDEPMAASADDLRRYVGDYVNDRGLIARTLLVEGRLHLIPPRADVPVGLVHRGNDTFTVGDRYVRVEFRRDRDGAVAGLRIHPEGYVASPIDFRRKARAEPDE